MEIRDMTAADLEARKAELASTDFDALATEELDAIETEVREINEELESRAAAEAKRAELRNMVATGTAPEAKEIETHEEERKMPDLKEIRSSQEYAAAYLNMIKTGEDAECRALLTADATAATGYVPVPTMLESEIQTAWETHQIMGLVKKSSFKGHVKVGFELSATGAAVHLEGDSAPNEETVTLGTVEIKNEMLKKWISISDEALEGTTVDAMGYLFREIAHRITEKAEEILIGKITTAGTVATATAVGVPKLTKEPAVDTVLEAMALLCGEAGNIKIAMNRGTYPAFRTLELNANYGIDVFEGHRGQIVFTDKLPAIAVASTGDVYMIVGDFANGVQANFPNGADSMQILTDPYTDATKDLVRIIGRQYVGMAVVADKRLVNVAKPAAPVTG